jgi:selenocysteine lyase/cysteine desulfurase
MGYLHSNEVRQEADMRMAAGSYLDTSPDQICFTDSTTMGLGLLYNGLRLAPGDQVLTTEHDFYSTHEALRFRAARDGVTVRRVRLYADPATASADEIVGNLIAALTPATRVVALTWVHSSTGVRLPIRVIADKLATLRQQQRPLLCVDGVHGFGAVDAGPKELGCDFLVSGCHKWLFGPRGTGLIWGRKEGWAKVNPVIPPFDGGSIGAWLGFAGATPASPSATPGGYHAFEHQWALAEAFDFHKTLGRARIAGRIQQLADALKAGLAGISGVKVMTPRSPELSAGVVCCAIDSMTPDKAVQALREQKVYASATPYAPSYLRFGTSIVTSAADVERAVAAVRKLT